MKSLLIIIFILYSSAINSIFLSSQIPDNSLNKLGTVLIINSYHPGYAWSDDEQSGILEVFQSINKDWLPYIEYLDCKRFSEKRIFNDQAKLLFNKYHDKIFSVIIVIDDSALEFIIEYQKNKFFQKAPIVFCGINNYNSSIIKEHSNITGIAEVLDPEGTIKIMLQLHPNADNILIITDDTISGLGMKKEVKLLIPKFIPRIKFKFIKSMTMKDVLKKLEELPKNYLVLDMGFITDKSGNTFQMTETSRLFSKHSSVPVYSAHGQKLGSGIVGGKLLSAREHGIAAAKLALRILKGEKAFNIPVSMESTAQYMFDYKIIKKFNIPLSKLPEKSIVINKPIPFFKANKNLILIALLIIFLLFLIICFLTIIMIQRNKSSLALRQSEERYRMLFEDSPISLWEVDFSKIKKQINNLINSGITELQSYFETDHKIFKNYLSMINILNVNKISLKLFMVDSKEELILNLSKFFTDKTFDIFKKALIYIIKGNFAFSSEIVFKTFNNDKFITNMNLSLDPDYKESWSRVIISLTDITAQKQTEEQIKSTLKEKEALLHELYHRTKNNMQVICAMLSLQSNYINNEEVKNIFKEMENRIISMALVHQKLYKSQNLSSINLKDYILELSQLLLNSYKIPSNRIHLNLENIDNISVTIDAAIPCGLILNELISNSLKHAFPDDKKGEIKIKLLKTIQGLIKLKVSDNGVGTSKNFNFRTNGKMGLQSIFAIGEHQLRGNVIFKSDKGLACIIKFKNNLYKERI